jgi:TPR repeat protein
MNSIKETEASELSHRTAAMEHPFEFDDSEERKKGEAITDRDARSYLTLSESSKEAKDLSCTERSSLAESEYMLGLWYQYHLSHPPNYGYNNSVHHYHRAFELGHVQAGINRCSLVQPSDKNMILLLLLQIVVMPTFDAASTSNKVLVHRELGKMYSKLKGSSRPSETAEKHLLKAIELNASTAATAVDKAQWYLIKLYLRETYSIENWSIALDWLERSPVEWIDPTMVNIWEDIDLMESSHSHILSRVLRLMDRYDRGYSDSYLNFLERDQIYFLCHKPKDLLRIRKEVAVPSTSYVGIRYRSAKVDAELQAAKEVISTSELLASDLMKAAADYLPWYSELQLTASKL